MTSSVSSASPFLIPCFKIDVASLVSDGESTCIEDDIISNCTSKDLAGTIFAWVPPTAGKFLSIDFPISLAH